MTGAILTNTVPAMTIRSASRGVPRITSAPNRAMSYLLVRLVAISTKQQESPKLNGQIEFLRPHARTSCSVVRAKLRRASIAGFRASSPRAGWSDPLAGIDRRIASGLLPRPGAGASRRPPFERAAPPQVRERRDEDDGEDHRLDVPGPPELARRHRPGEQEDGLEVEDDEEHGDEVELDREPHPGGSLGNDAGFVRLAGGALRVALPQQVRDADHRGDQADD